LDALKPQYQLVLQFPFESTADFDAVIELEERLIEEFSGSATHVDGHDSGSGEANIFILTPNPNESFALAQVVVKKTFGISAEFRAGFRRIDSDEYAVLWPAGARGFSVA
jgi:hypothetical protein